MTRTQHTFRYPRSPLVQTIMSQYNLTEIPPTKTLTNTHPPLKIAMCGMVE